MQTTATAQTDKASRYMTQLAKHWSHKFEVTFDATQAVIHLPTSVCTMTAHPDRLEVKIEGEDPAGLVRMQGVFLEHLNRFAFREPISLDWAPPA